MAEAEKKIDDEAKAEVKDTENGAAKAANEDGLVWSGKFAGGIRADISRRLRWYRSDWVDGIFGGTKIFTAGLYMFFACLAPGIAFGAYFDQHSGGKSGVVEYLVTQSVSGVIFAIFSGQPLVILRPTGPITVFISQLYTISKSMDIPFLVAQAWVGIFVGTYMILIAVTDSCAAIRYCSRFTQDMFGFFVSVIFVFMGSSNILDKFGSKADSYSSTHQLLLTLGTLYLTFQLVGFRKTRFLGNKLRDVIGDFAVPISVVVGTVVANLLTVEVEPLPVPSQFGPTQSERSWIVDICPEDSCGKAIGVGAVAAIPLVFLFFIDQNVTMLLTQHPDHNLKKGSSFHWNFFMLGCFNIVFPLFGCPYVTGSLPHSPQFVQALATTEVVKEHGHERTKIKSVFENRVSPLLVNLLVLATLPVIGELKYLPTAVICDALFLFMGLSGLPGNELFERIKLIFTQEALYPPLKWTKEDVPRMKMHLFTFIQLSFVGILFGVSRSSIALAFPVFLIASIPTRMLLPKLTCGALTRKQVMILDHAQKGSVQTEEGEKGSVQTEEGEAACEI